MKFSNIPQKLAVVAMLAFIAVQSKAQGSPLTGLSQPGNGYSNQAGTGPSATVFNGKIYFAFIANDSSDTLWITTSTDGSTFTYPGANYLGIVMQAHTAPSITTWNNELWIAYTGTSGQIYLISSPDGTTFTSPTAVLYETGSPFIANSQPTIAVFNGSLWITAVVNGSGTTTYLESVNTSNGTSFLTNDDCGISAPDGAEPQTGAGVGLTVYGGSQLAYAFQAQGDWNHELVVCTTTGTASGTYYEPAGFEVGSGVSALTYQGDLVLAYKELHNGNDLIISASNGTDFNDFLTNTYSGIQTNGNQEISPGAFLFGDYYYLAYTQNNSGHHLYVTHN